MIVAPVLESFRTNYQLPILRRDFIIIRMEKNDTTWSTMMHVYISQSKETLWDKINIAEPQLSRKSRKMTISYRYQTLLKIEVLSCREMIL